MNRKKLLAPVAGALLATGISLAATAGMAGATASTTPVTTHSVTQSSKANYSSAVEKPGWSFTCDSSSHKWTFDIDGVQVIDSTGHTWNRTQGPWSIGVWATNAPGPVPFNASATLHQNKTNGLFQAYASGTSSTAGTWCQKGSSVTVDAFSGAEQPLLLDGTLG